MICGQFSPDSVTGVNYTEPFCQEKTNSKIAECEAWTCVALCESAEELLSLKIIKMVTIFARGRKTNINRKDNQIRLLILVK